MKPVFDLLGHAGALGIIILGVILFGRYELGRREEWERLVREEFTRALDSALAKIQSLVSTVQRQEVAIAESRAEHRGTMEGIRDRLKHVEKKTALLDTNPRVNLKKLMSEDEE